MPIPKIPWKTISVQLSKHAPSILTGVGIGGFVTSIFMAVKESPKYFAEREAKKYPNDDFEDIKLSLKDELIIAGKHYWPVVVVGGISAGCILLSDRISLQRQAALAAACSISETALQNYKAKAIEVLGAKEEHNQIGRAINEDYLQKNKEDILSDRNLYPIDMQIILDKYSGTKFYMTVEDVRRIVNEFNARLIEDDVLPYAELWYMMQEEAANKKNIFEPDSIFATGWRFEGQKKLITPEFDNHMVDNQPVVIVSFRPNPESDPYHYYCK